MSDGVDSLIRWRNARALDERTVVPGIIDDVEPNSPDREQIIDFRLGIADLSAGEAEDLGIAPTVPMLSIGSGGFGMLMPAGGEALGVVVDRASGKWRANKTPGEADVVNGKRSKVLADLAALPFQYTASEGAPASWDGQLLYGPAGVAILIETDGTVTITGQADPEGPPATSTTIVMEPGGNITLTVGVGKSVNIGGVGAAALALGQKVIDAIDGFLGAGVPIAMDGGANLKATMIAFWNGVKATILALKAKGV